MVLLLYLLVLLLGDLGSGGGCRGKSAGDRCCAGNKGGGGFGLPGGAKLRLLSQWSLQRRLLDHRKIGSKGRGPGVHGVVVDGIFNERINVMDCCWLGSFLLLSSVLIFVALSEGISTTVEGGEILVRLESKVVLMSEVRSSSTCNLHLAACARPSTCP